MITAISLVNNKLVNTCITSHNYHLFVIAFEIHALNNFQVYNTVLLIIVTMLHLRSPELIHLIIF